jgi:hypothetical protein
MEREAIGRGGKPTASFVGAAPRHRKAELMLRALVAKGHLEVTVEQGGLRYAFWERDGPL